MMNKKEYIAPNTIVLSMQLQTMIAYSVAGTEGDAEVGTGTGDPGAGSEGGGAARAGSWNDDE